MFDDLAKIGKGAGGEIQLTDGIARLMQREPVYAFEFEGKRYDCGNKLGYLQATVEYGLKHPSLGGEFAAYLKELVREPLELVRTAPAIAQCVRPRCCWPSSPRGAGVRAAARIAPIRRLDCRANCPRGGRDAARRLRGAMLHGARRLRRALPTILNAGVSTSRNRCACSTRSMSRSKPFSSDETSEIACPRAPARPVRPMRCT